MADKCLSVIKMIHYIFLIQERDYSFDLNSREKKVAANFIFKFNVY